MTRLSAFHALLEYFSVRRDALIDSLIVPPVVKFRGHDEALAKRTEKRRELAEQKKVEGRKIDVGNDRLDRTRKFGRAG